MAKDVHVVTGAFGYSGRWIAKELLNCGYKVRTLTNAIGRDDPFNGELEVRPIIFTDHDSMVSNLSDADVLYNTYWVRYKDRKGGYSHDLAVSNTKKLIAAAEDAGIRRIVHFSVAHPDKAPDWTYFNGKMEVEKMIIDSRLSHAILRPTVFFGGKRDVLINNMAWLIRRFPVFGVFGLGSYLIQPVHIADVARVAVEKGALKDNVVLDVAGPEKFSYYEYAKLISQSLGVRRAIIPVPPIVAWVVGKVVGILVSDNVITRAEIRGLMDGLMASDEKPLGVIKFSEWIEENGTTLGLRYQNDMNERKYQSPSLLYNPPNSTE